MTKVATFSFFAFLLVAYVMTDDTKSSVDTNNYMACKYSDNTKYNVYLYQKKYPNLSYDQISHIICK